MAVHHITDVIEICSKVKDIVMIREKGLECSLVYNIPTLGMFSRGLP